MKTNTSQFLSEIHRLKEKRRSATNDEIRLESRALKYEVARGTPLVKLIPRAFSLAAEACQRELNMYHHDVQFVGGYHLVRQRIAEMKTGEGKTLTAILPTYLFALAGRGAHVVTVNDYLAARDMDLLAPVYRRLGLRCGAIQSESSPEERKEAYSRDITYGTAKELGFDFLRDRLARLRGDGATDGQVMRELYFVLVDETDSVLIDEAVTPLIIGMINQRDEEIAHGCYRWASQNAATFQEDLDFRYDNQKRKVTLTSKGIHRLRALPETRETRGTGIRQLYEYMENAIKVNRDFHLDKNYAVVDEKVVIIDEFTGRPAEGRQWQKGIHQAVEAKEDLEISPQTKTAATITIQTFFRRYRNFSGMTGTAWTSRREFRRVFRKRVVRVPTHRPVQRTQWSTRVLPDFPSKLQAIVDEVKNVVEQGRAVLIGTRSVNKSEALSERLLENKIQHQILNARRLEREADIVARAGEPGRITVATNMAGRGTDIRLADEVREAGGLHVILTEIHESERIDWQLIGRGSRQGDPGTFRIFVSLDDELLTLGLGPKLAKKVRQRYAGSKQIPLQAFRWFRKAQEKLERRYLVDRLMLLRHDRERQERHLAMGQDPFLSSHE